MEDSNLIFLISQPRAGSTLLQNLLGNHPKIFTTPEPWTMLHSVYALRSEGYTAEYNSSWASSALKGFFKVLPEGKCTYIEGLRRMHLYLYDRALETSGKHYFLDKTPRYYHIIPELQQIFPNAFFIILLRNPLAVLSSILETWIKDDWSKLVKFKHDLVYAPILLLEGINLLQQQTNCTVIHYEKLITNPEDELKTICEKLKIQFTHEIFNKTQKNEYVDGYGYKDQKQNAFSGKTDHQNSDKWITILQKSPQNWRIADDYLKILGSKTLEQLGYSYDELFEKLHSHRPGKYSTWTTSSLNTFLEMGNWKNYYRVRRKIHLFLTKL